MRTSKTCKKVRNVRRSEMCEKKWESENKWDVSEKERCVRKSEMFQEKVREWGNCEKKCKAM